MLLLFLLGVLWITCSKIRGLFITRSNIYDEAVLLLFLQNNFIVDVRLGSKYASEVYFQIELWLFALVFYLFWNILL